MSKAPSISFAITVCNEKEEIRSLVEFLRENKRPHDEIVVLFDLKNGDEELFEELQPLNKFPNFHIWRGFFDGDFAQWKNKLNSYCTKDYIFQIDADEQVSPSLMVMLPSLLEMNQEVDLYWVPRVNTVEGITEEHIAKWRWHVNEFGFINWPDWQGRIYRNREGIEWTGKVHERITGYKTIAQLPAVEDYSLRHPKTIERQEKQNKLYDSL